MSDDYNIGLDEFDVLYNEAEELLEQATSFAQIGKFSSSTEALVYRNGNFEQVTAEEWRSFPEFKILNLHATVDIREFNPSFERGYTRKVQVKRAPWNRKEADGSYTRIPSDWEAIFEPSLFEVTGIKNASKALSFLADKYVEARDVKQQPTKQQPEPAYNTIKLVKIFASREEAYAAYQALQGGNGGESAPVGTGLTREFTTDEIDSVKLMANSPLSNEDIVKSLGVPDLTPDDVQKIRSM